MLKMLKPLKVFNSNHQVSVCYTFCTSVSAVPSPRLSALRYHECAGCCEPKLIVISDSSRCIDIQESVSAERCDAP